MICRWPGGVVTTLCDLLLFAAPLFAEGDWALWIQEVATDTELLPANQMAWRRTATFESKAACFAEASSKAEELANTLRASDRIIKERRMEVQRLGLASDHLAVKRTFVAGLYDGARMWTFYRCLPGTMEPRGAKAK
jgi:predicted TPR repeat methyltransferase